MRRRQRFYQGLLVGAVVAGIVVALLVLRLFASAQLSMTNLYFVPAPVSGDITLVALDDASV